MAFPVPDVTPSAGQGLQTGLIYVNICSKIFVFSLKTDCKKNKIQLSNLDVSNYLPLRKI